MAEEKEEFDPSKKLKDKRQEKFCRLYAIHHNGYKAAVEANYSERSARNQAYRLMTRDDISKRIKYLEDEAFEAIGVTNAKIAAEYAKLAFSNLVDVIDEEGNLIDFENLSSEVQAALSEVTVIEKTDKEGNTTVRRKIKLHDKKGALDSIAKIKNFFVEKKVISNDDDKPFKVEHSIPDYIRKSLDETYKS